MKTQLQYDFERLRSHGPSQCLDVTAPLEQGAALKEILRMLRGWPRLTHVALQHNYGGDQASRTQSAGSVSNPPQASQAPQGEVGGAWSVQVMVEFLLESIKKASSKEVSFHSQGTEIHTIRWQA